MALLKYSLLLNLLFFSTFAFAQLKCESIFLGDSLYASTKLLIQNEFNIKLNTDDMNFLDQIINRDEEISSSSKMKAQEIFRKLELTEVVYWKAAEKFLERPLSLVEVIALKFARGLGRTEQGQVSGFLAFSGNYTRDQIMRKDRVLELAGFTFDERLALLGNELIEDVLTKYDASSLLRDNVLETSDSVILMNKAVLMQMNNESTVIKPGKRQQTMNDREANVLYEAVTRNPVARILRLRKYDPTGGTGFCFGRALTTHLEALSRGIHKESIRKVFVVGSMKSIIGRISWQFHVATAVKRTDGGWWVIDPLVGKPITLEEWHEKMYAKSNDGKLRLYVTHAAQFGAASNRRYTRAAFMVESYNGYFKDLIKYFRMKTLGKPPESSAWKKVFDWVLATLNIGI